MIDATRSVLTLVHAGASVNEELSNGSHSQGFGKG